MVLRFNVHGQHRSHARTFAWRSTLSPGIGPRARATSDTRCLALGPRSIALATCRERVRQLLYTRSRLLNDGKVDVPGEFHLAIHEAEVGGHVEVLLQR